jgi:fumarate hydratase class II
MLVTAPNTRIGYDKAVKIGKLALAENITLKQAADQLGYVRPEDFGRWVVPAAMTVPGATLPGGGG